MVESEPNNSLKGRDPRTDVSTPLRFSLLQYAARARCNPWCLLQSYQPNDNRAVRLLAQTDQNFAASSNMGIKPFNQYQFHSLLHNPKELHFHRRQVSGCDHSDMAGGICEVLDSCAGRNKIIS